MRVVELELRQFCQQLIARGKLTGRINLAEPDDPFLVNDEAGSAALASFLIPYVVELCDLTLWVEVSQEWKW